MQTNRIKMRRITSLILALIVAISSFAQTPKAILESMDKNPNLSHAIASPYPGAPVEKMADAPKGFKPFYFSLTGRHGSRYELKRNGFNSVCTILNKAHDMGILTKDGELFYDQAKRIAKAQEGHDGELSSVGIEQWHNIAERAYKNFEKVFKSGSIEAKSSTSLRCVFSMVSFNNAIKGKVPSIKISQYARVSELWIVRPLADDPKYTDELKGIIKAHRDLTDWKGAQKSWEESTDLSSFLSKVSTNPEALIKCCGDVPTFTFAKNSLTMLTFSENIGFGRSELLSRLFTPEELYRIYIYYEAKWVNGSIGRGNDAVEAHQSYMRPLVEDILNKAQSAIDGKNPDVANLRFTHDSYMGPLYSVMGYEGCVPQWNKNLELVATSYNHGTISPMASNLQIVLYRNKKGEVLVRSLINERDGYLPIKCETAPFYPWEEFCKYINENLKQLDSSKEKVLKKMGK